MNTPLHTDKPTRYFDLTAQQAAISIAGQVTVVLTYNGSFPRPLLEVQECDSLMLKNDLPCTQKGSILQVPSFQEMYI